MERLQMKIDQAGIEVAAGELLRTMAFLAVLGGVGGYLITGGAVVGVPIGVAIGGYSYWAYLGDRRDRNRMRYQAALADVTALLIEGFKEGGTVQAALQKVIAFGPEIVRSDFEEVARRLQGGLSIDEAFKPVQERRRDPILDAIAQMVVVRVKRGGQASEALGGLFDIVRERVRLRMRIRAELSQVVGQLKLLASLPFLVVAFLRFTAPEYAVFWRTFLGQAMLFTAWGITAVGYWLGVRFVSKAMGIDETIGVVETSAQAARRMPGLALAEE